MQRNKALTVVGASALAATALTANTAGAASTVPQSCRVYTGNGNPYFGHIAANPYANMRCTPGGTITGQAYLGDFVRVVCWSYGPTESGWGGTNNYWDYLADYDAEGVGFVADVWVDTGGPVTNVVPQC